MDDTKTISLRIQHSNITGIRPVLADIVRLIYARQLVGKMLIITSQPIATRAIIHKMWLEIIHQHVRDRKHVIEPAVFDDVTKSIEHMKQLKFTVNAPFENPYNDVFMLYPCDLEEILPQCTTIFVMAAVQPDLIEPVIGCMPDNGLVVWYEGVIAQETAKYIT